MNHIIWNTSLSHTDGATTETREQCRTPLKTAGDIVVQESYQKSECPSNLHHFHSLFSSASFFSSSSVDVASRWLYMLYNFVV